MQLYDYQESAVKKCFNFFLDKSSGMLLLSAPTGTGKSIIQLALLAAIKGSAVVHIITSKITIIRGYLRILGVCVDAMSDKEIKREGRKHGIYTYATYRNRLVDCVIEIPDVLIIDEAHHMMETNKLSSHILYYRSKMKVIGFTATPFRATARTTKDFLAMWDEVHPVISIVEAWQRGFWTRPKMRTVGTIDDDALVVRNGEFVITSFADIDAASKGTLFETILALLHEYNECRAVVEVPNTEIAYALTDYLNALSWPTMCLTHKTKSQERKRILAALEQGTHSLIEVSILSEGFDMPDLPLVIDANPKFSPVRFLQLLGRLTRKSPIEKTYVSLCRNIERHGYLLEGVLPPSTILECQKAFGGSSSRAGKRVFGNDRLGVLKAIPFQCANGVWGSFYLVESLNDHVKTSYAIILLPHTTQTVVAQRSDSRLSFEKWKFGKWKLSELPGDFQGYNTAKEKKTISTAQKRFWKTCAGKYGLLPRETVTAREFQIMPILKDLGVRLK